MDSAQAAPLTADDLLSFGQREYRFEVVDGRLVEMAPAGLLHVLVGGNVYRALYAAAAENRLGYVCADHLMCVLYTDPETGIRAMRAPDVCFIRKGRLPQDFDLSLPFPGAPDLAVEVVSPGEDADTLLSKIRDYFAYGSEQVWVLYPAQRELHQYIRGEKSARHHMADDTFSAEPLFPGLTLPVAALFALPDLD